MRSWKAFLTTLLICLAIIGATVVVANAVASARTGRKQAEIDALKPAEHIPNVKVETIKSQLVEDAILVTGSIEAWDDRTVSAEVAGIMEWRGIEEGDVVKEGQELVRIDTDTIKAQLDESVAHEKWAKQELERAKNLTTKGAMGERDQQQAQAQMDMASAGVRVRSIMLAKSAVKAPISGIVDKIFAKRDEFVDAGRPLVHLVQVDRVKALAGIPERDISHFKVGDKAKLKVDALPNRPFEGVIHRIATTADPSTRTFVAEIEVPNADGALKPGMIVRTTFVRNAFPDSVLVPLFAIVSLENGRLAFVEKDGIAEVRQIEIGVLVGSTVQVTKGLAPGDRLIVVGQRDLKPGGKVNVKDIVE